MPDELIPSKMPLSMKLLLLFSICIGLVTFILAAFFGLHYIFLIFGSLSIALLTFIIPELGFFVLIAIMPVELYTAIFAVELFGGLALTSTRVLGLIVSMAWLARIMVMRQRIIGIKNGTYVLLFLLSVALSSIAACDQEIVFVKVQTFIQLIVFYFLCVNLINGEKMLRRVLWVFVLFTGLSAILGVLQYFGIIFGGMGTWEGAVRVAAGARGSDTFSTCLFTGMFITIGLLLGEKAKIAKIVLPPIIPLIIAASIFTFSRGGAVAFLGGLLYFTIRQKKRIKPIIMMLLLVLLVIPFIPEVYRSRLSPSYAATDPSVLNRIYASKAALKIWLHNPLTGVGIGNFRVHGIKYMPLGFKSHMVTHNTYAEVLAELGILGFVFFTAIIYRTLKSMRSYSDRMATEGKWEMRKICLGLEIGFVTFLVGNIFLSNMDLKYFWFLFALGAALREWPSSSA